MSNKHEYKDIRKIRYQILRELGFSSKKASKYSGRSLDVSKVTIIEEEVKDKKGNVKTVRRVQKDDAYYEAMANASEIYFQKWSGQDIKDIVENYQKYFNNVVRKKNDSVLTDWGFATQHEPYRSYTFRTVSMIMKRLNFNRKQAIFFLYYATQLDQPFEVVYREATSTQEFEIYKKAGFSGVIIRDKKKGKYYVKDGNELAIKDVYRIRYQLLREAGLSGAEARRFRGRAIDVSKIKLDSSGKVVRNKHWHNAVKKLRREMGLAPNTKPNKYWESAMKYRNKNK